MDSRITSAVLSAVCALWVALSGVADAQTENFNEEDSKPVLGVIIPGKTTLSDFEEVLTSKGCHFSEGQPEKDGLEGEITISNSCFDLPGKPIVHAGCDKQGLVSMLKIEWSSDEDGSLYNRYYLALEKSYGRPELTKTVDDLKKSITWSIPEQRMCVNLSECDPEGHGILNYVIGEDAQKSFENYNHQHQKSGKDLEKL